MGMPETTGRWTRDMVLALPDDGNRYELFDGELLVTSAPAVLHQMAVTALIKRLLPYVPAHRLGQLLTSPADPSLDGGPLAQPAPLLPPPGPAPPPPPPADRSLDGEQLAQPDLFIAPLGSGPTPTRWENVPNPILVIEILSPSTARYDRIVKRRRHQVAGVPEYWVVDLDARVVERWRPADDRPEILDERLTWQPSPEHPPLEIDLPALFREVWGEP